MPWTPSLHATHVMTAAEGAPTGTVLVEHFNDPFEFTMSNDSEACVRAAAYAYLTELLQHLDLQRRLGIPPDWVAALAPAAATGASASYFGWMPVGPAHVTGPRGSLIFKPASGADHIVVLYAAERMSGSDYLGSGFGLAVATHIRSDSGNRQIASFVGLSATLPFGNFARHRVLRGASQGYTNVFNTSFLFGNPEANRTMAAGANLTKFAVRGVRFAATADQVWIERRGIGVRPVVEGGKIDGDGDEIPYFVSMLSSGDGNGNAMVHTIGHVAPLVADATATPVQAEVFDDDPSSRLGRLLRPTRDGLEPQRQSKPIFSSSTKSGALEYTVCGKTIVRVKPSPRFVRADRPHAAENSRPVTIPTNGQLPIASDDASAVQAFFHARDLVQRLEAYGWSNPADYFRLTRPEIKIFYRSGVAPGPGKDGRTVNARVIPDGWADDQMGKPPNVSTSIGIHLAWADLRRRSRAPWQPGGTPEPAIPLGVAIDRRWMWHEFGHVLLVASTGELEFRFAHSPGDAMAAIVADPASKLRDRRRGMTFPFVFVPRYHNRCCSQGWSWSGSMHAELARVPQDKHPRRKGYASEQILSSSLFRLYRCIGGDTAGGVKNTDEERFRASHYTLYLIMQAMQLMGDALIQPTSTPEAFVHWLRQADRQVGKWTASYDNQSFERMGGTLSKTIRWAFEAQGLYGKGNGPGAAEPVDIYIADSRRTSDDAEDAAVSYGPGAYVPVPLCWQQRTLACEAPLWQADRVNGIVDSEGKGTVEVRVGNRGTVAANDVSVRLLHAVWSNSELPDWTTVPGTWTCCELQGAATQNIPPGTTATFTFTRPVGSGIHIFVAEATCNDDRANTDPALALPCSRLPTPLVDLVANDNNLGLLVVDLDS